VIHHMVDNRLDSFLRVRSKGGRPGARKDRSPLG
jgi:hypothetical protein